MQLFSISPHLIVSNSAPVFINDYAGNPDTRKIQYNSNIGTLEIHNGYNYVPIHQPVQIDLSVEAKDAIMWSISKMNEEKELEQRMEKYPALKNAYENFKTIDLLTREVTP